MAKGTKIEWADDTQNAEMGCDGCELWDPKKGVRICYAGVLTEMRVSKGRRKGWPPAFDNPTIFPGRIAEAARWRDLTGTTRRKPRFKPWLDGMPRVIFVNDMGDGFTASLPDDWLAPELPVMAASPHLWLFLTKRPDRQRAFSLRHELPSNVWAGTSITSPQDQRLRHLMRTRASVRWVSYEPMLGPVDWRPYLADGLNWLVVGGASGPTYQNQMMDLAWLADTVEQCRAAGVPIFVKQDSARHAGVRGRIPDELWIREYPRGIPGLIPVSPDPSVVVSRRRREIDVEIVKGTRESREIEVEIVKGSLRGIEEDEDAETDPEATPRHPGGDHPALPAGRDRCGQDSRMTSSRKRRRRRRTWSG